MTRAKRLKPIVSLAEQSTQSALAKVGQANAALLQGKRQLEDLLQYRNEYIARLRDNDTVSISAKKALGLRGFLQQVEQAIIAQQQKVSTQQSQLKIEQQRWQQVKHKEQAMTSLMTRYHQQEVRLAIKQEQRLVDENNITVWQRKQH
ncbi:MAG TPA: flagellar export protein FliJ [Gammaproteobacteria bacterium]|nr:flagellar export protein FliJ [Gammaproteobacteria bacterium]